MLDLTLFLSSFLQFIFIPYIIRMYVLRLSRDLHSFSFLDFFYEFNWLWFIIALWYFIFLLIFHIPYYLFPVCFQLYCISFWSSTDSYVMWWIQFLALISYHLSFFHLHFFIFHFFICIFSFSFFHLHFFSIFFSSVRQHHSMFFTATTQLCCLPFQESSCYQYSTGYKYVCWPITCSLLHVQQNVDPQRSTYRMVKLW